jgi:hypothetical protein
MSISHWPSASLCPTQRHGFPAAGNAGHLAKMSVPHVTVTLSPKLKMRLVLTAHV